MSAYLIANYTVTNADEYAKYPPAVAPTLAPFGGEAVAIDFNSEPVEGAPGAVSVVVKFPDKQAAQNWYHSDAYQAVAGLRQDNSKGFVLFADGLD